MTSDAPVVAHMDADLSTELSALLPLIAPIVSGHSEVSIESRLAGGAHASGGPSGRSSRGATTCCCG
jgi:hypothetical protein